MVFSSAFSAMRARRPTSWFTSFTCAYACAVRVACLTAPLAYSSWIAMVRSALSIEMRVIRAAASKEAAANWDIGFTGVGIFERLRSNGWAAYLVRRNNSILGRARGAVKEILVHCTTGWQPQRTKAL